MRNFRQILGFPFVAIGFILLGLGMIISFGFLTTRQFTTKVNEVLA